MNKEEYTEHLAKSRGANAEVKAAMDNLKEVQERYDVLYLQWLAAMRDMDKANARLSLAGAHMLLAQSEFSDDRMKDLTS